MKMVDEYELELMHERQRRAERDEEREPFAARKRRPRRKPRYSRFRVLHRINEAFAEQLVNTDTSRKAA